jgi:hypothetical protein
MLSSLPLLLIPAFVLVYVGSAIWAVLRAKNPDVRQTAAWSLAGAGAYAVYSFSNLKGPLESLIVPHTSALVGCCAAASIWGALRLRRQIINSTFALRNVDSLCALV